MTDNAIIVGLTSIVVLGVGAQWIGRRLGFPSILLLLPAGILAGEVGLVDPDELFGEALFPLVTLLVALLLFQSGLNLRVRDLPADARRPVVRLITVGALLTLAGASVAVSLIFDTGLDMALLIGAILVVSGPTVVGPLLEVVRPSQTVHAVLAWESVVLDPLGATLGVIMLNLVLAAGRGGIHPIPQMLGRLGLGIAVGVVAAGLLILVLSQFYVTDNMEAAVALAFAVLAFGVAEVLMSEAGLFATVTLGVVAANQRLVPTARITGFGETLEVLIIGILFIVLGALVEVAELTEQFWGIAALVAILVIAIRPIAAALSLIRTNLPRNARAMVGWMDPRGIVAAATAAQFAGTLDANGIDPGVLQPVVFGVIIGTGVIYGLTARPASRILGQKRPDPTGVILLGLDDWVFDLASRLHAAGVPVLVVNSMDPLEAERRAGGVPTASITESQQELTDLIEYAGIEKAVVAAPPGPLLTLVVAELVEILGRRHVLRLPHADHAGSHLFPTHLNPQPFAPGITASEVDSRVAAGARVEVVSDDLPEGAIPLAVVRPNGTVDLKPGTRKRPTPNEGATRIALVGG